MNLLVAERIKLFTTPSFWWCAALAVVLAVGPVVLLAALLPDGAGTANGSEFVVIGLVVVLVMAAMTVTGEHRHRTVRTTFLAVPDRTVALLAKAAVVAVAAVALGLVVGFGGRGVAWLLQPGADLAVTTAAQWRLVAGPALVFAIAAVLAVAVGTLVRSTAGSVSLLLVWVLVLEPVLGFLPRVGDGLRRWSPFENAAYFLQAGESDPARQLFSAGMPFGPWGSLVYFAGITAALLAPALLVANRRDA